MNNYKIYNSNWAVIKMFQSFQDAEEWRDANKPGLSIEDLGPVPQKTEEELYQSDVEFLKGLFNEFNVLNRQQPQTPAEMQELQLAFGEIKVLADAGSINYLRASIDALVTEPTAIGGVYSTARKNADLAKIDDYLAVRLYA